MRAAAVRGGRRRARAGRLRGDAEGDGCAGRLQVRLRGAAAAGQAAGAAPAARGSRALAAAAWPGMCLVTWRWAGICWGTCCRRATRIGRVSRYAATTGSWRAGPRCVPTPLGGGGVPGPAPMPDAGTGYLGRRVPGPCGTHLPVRDGPVWQPGHGPLVTAHMPATPARGICRDTPACAGAPACARPRSRCSRRPRPCGTDRYSTARVFARIHSGPAAAICRLLSASIAQRHCGRAVAASGRRPAPPAGEVAGV